MDISNIFNVKLHSTDLNEEINIGKEHTLHLLNIEGISGAASEVTLNSNVRFDGSVNTSRRIKHRNIVFEAEYDGNDKVEARKKIIKFFNIHHNGFFSIQYANDRYKIPYIAESLNAPMINTHLPFKFRVSLICPNPFFTDYEDGINNIVEWRKALVFPLKIPQKRGLVFGKKRKNTFTNVFNAGDITTGMIVTFKANGNVTNPFIIDTDTREIIKIEKTMKAGEVYIVDTNPGNKGVEMINNDDNFNNGYRYLSKDSAFFQLDIGDNILRYGADENINNLDVTIQYQNKYLGV